MAAFTVLDLGLMAGTSGLVTIPSNAVVAGSTPIENDVAADLTSGGRFDVYDPQGYADESSEETAGLPDDNVLAQIPSVGGYGSIVSGTYNARTLTHMQGQLNVARLGAGDLDGLDGLDLQAIVTVPEYFLLPVRGAPTTVRGARQVTEARGSDQVLPLGIDAYVPGSGYPTYPAPRGELATGQASTWFFGESLRPAQARVLLTSVATGARVRFGKVRADGATSWGAPVTVAVGARSAAGPLPPGPASGLAVQVVSGRLPSHQATIEVGKRVYELDGSLSAVIRPGPWRPQAPVDGYSLFVRAGAPHPVSAVGRAGRPPPHISVLSNGANAETVSVRTASPAVVVRDVAWDVGWHASVTVNGGPPRTVRVAPRGLVEQVRLPAGADLVTFTYRPPHWLVASILSEGSSLFLLVLLVLAVVTLFRRRHQGRHRGSRHRGVATVEVAGAKNLRLRSPAPLRPGPPRRPGHRGGIPTSSRDPYDVSSRGGPA
jgi:hypothetical protein